MPFISRIEELNELDVQSMDWQPKGSETPLPPGQYVLTHDKTSLVVNVEDDNQRLTVSNPEGAEVDWPSEVKFPAVDDNLWFTEKVDAIRIKNLGDGDVPVVIEGDVAKEGPLDRLAVVYRSQLPQTE